MTGPRLLLATLFLPPWLALAGAASGGEAAADRPARLAAAPSPYLASHADNAVRWRLPGPRAIAEARARDVPLFLSLGYAACAWCHVLERESFMDPGIGAFVERHFVPVLVDREVEPDLDQRLQEAARRLGAPGGWPNNVLLTPEGAPFAAAGYLPKKAFRAFLDEGARAWGADRRAVEARARQVLAALDEAPRTMPGAAEPPSLDAIARRAAPLLGEIDDFHGGFGTAPKFPRESRLLLLETLALTPRLDPAPWAEALALTRAGMAAGAIHDHVGGGFHRYATEPDWSAPHFEKMLYDQALLGRLYATSCRIGGSADDCRTLRRLVAFVLREMVDPATGLFLGALDAESPDPVTGAPSDGVFYLWSRDEIAAALGGAGPAARMATLFGLPENGRQALHLEAPPLFAVAEAGFDAAAFDALLARMAAWRARRPLPQADGKSIVAWNAAMLETLFAAGWLFEDEGLLRATAARLDRLRLRARLPGGRLARFVYRGRPRGEALLLDHAALGLALLAAHDYGPAGARKARLEQALRLAGEMIAAFRRPGQPWRGQAQHALSPLQGGASSAIPPLLDRNLPAANALALLFLDRLARRLPEEAPPHEGVRDRDRIRAIADDLARALAPRARDPHRHAGLLRALAERAGGETGPVRSAARGHVRASFRPHPSAMLYPRPALAPPARRGPGEAGGAAASAASAAPPAAPTVSTAAAAGSPARRALRLVLEIAPGWHVNAAVPTDEWLIATQIRIDGVPVTPEGGWPRPETVEIGLAAAPLDVFTGRLDLSLPRPVRPGWHMIEIDLQACSDRLCLPPETLAWRWREEG